ncbi:hypothetical protein PENNAL_c0010G03365 [Penicillium nalgiovense]|uniref:Uncharacterized protein n=1 Tax=Penicillium nalgiovense TaxID=60175 RepID=A0A1V6YUU8_PENNA|nr:hypothetical protein PENNAL_c0010G03365 [Penicillium nalgiovense]
MTRMTNLMECFKLGDVELNGPLDDNSLDSFKDTYFIAFIAKDAKFDQSTHTALTCFAEHDYIVVAPNPTGSTGYGMALGVGYGGYMVIWMKGGPPWGNPEAWRKWDPAQFAGNWKTPQQIIHGELIRQHPVTEALAAFNALNLQSVEVALLLLCSTG